MAPLARLNTVVIDCAEPVALAAFYHRLTGWEIVDSDPEWATLSGDGPVRLAFQRVPGYQGPGWPDDAKHAHLDLTVATLGQAVQQAVALGATAPKHQPGGEAFVVLADPEGHLFCLTDAS